MASNAEPVVPGQTTEPFRSKKTDWSMLLLVLPAILIVIGGLMYLSPRRYVSTSQILVLHKQSPNPFPPNAAVTIIPWSHANELLLLRSEELIRSAIQDGELDKLASLGETPVIAVLKGLSVSQIDRTDVIQVEFVSPRAKDAQLVVAALTRAYVDYNKRHHQEIREEYLALVTGVSNDLTSDLKRLGADLAKAEAKLPTQHAEMQSDLPLEVQSLRNQIKRTQTMYAAISRRLEHDAFDEPRVTVIAPASVGTRVKTPFSEAFGLLSGE